MLLSRQIKVFCWVFNKLAKQNCAATWVWVVRIHPLLLAFFLVAALCFCQCKTQLWNGVGFWKKLVKLVQQSSASVTGRPCGNFLWVKLQLQVCLGTCVGSRLLDHASLRPSLSHPLPRDGFSFVPSCLLTNGWGEKKHFSSCLRLAQIAALSPRPTPVLLRRD